ncbi:MAG TPA: lysine 2,3-aminomutase [Candidatus Magasanikbacteria bacterium]|nr:lysine 2,3-aminomutase [Candidatus Magasanikbacteria bacterium]
MLATRLSPYLKKLTAKHPAIYKQFVPSVKEENDNKITLVDPLTEEHFTPVRGLVHKHDNRVLVLLTMNCSAYCRFCTRRRKVSDIAQGVISEADLDNMVKYIKKHPKIKELIFSGGDPLTVPVILKKALEKFTKLSQIKVIRVGTRLMVSDPRLINEKVLDALRVVKKQPLYLMVHFEHPAEITLATIKAVKKLQTVSTMLLCQSVFLKGVNDNVEILEELFSRLIEIGVKPYYLSRCDYVRGAEHFIVPIKKEIKIFTELRIRLSGIACLMYIIDVPGGMGKVPVPADFWQFDCKQYTDFTGKKFKVVETKK